MTAPITRTAPTGEGVNGRRPAGPASGLSTVNRPKGYVALAVMLIVGLAATGYWFYDQAGAKVPVLVAAREIPAGQVITSSDLTTVSVAGAVTAVGAAHVSELVGRSASVEILPGSLLQLGMVTSASPVPANDALIGVAEAPGQIPSSGLAPGDVVQVIGLPPRTGSIPTRSPAVLATATVVDVRPNPAVEGGVLLTLLAPKVAAYPVSAASDAGQAALVKIAAPS